MYAESYILARLTNRNVDKDISSMRTGGNIDKDVSSTWKDMDVDRYDSGRWKLNPEEVCDRLEGLGLSQNDLAREVGVSSGYLSRLMNGTRCPSARTCRLLEGGTRLPGLRRPVHPGALSRSCLKDLN